MLDLKKPEGPQIDGVSLAGLLEGQKGASIPERTLFAHVQRTRIPPKWKSSVAMKKHWRLMDRKQLYNLAKDPGQQKDVAKEHPEVVKQLRADYEVWWKSLEEDRKQTVRIILGGKENPTTLYSHDWFMPGAEVAAWHQNHIKRGDLKNGPWNVNVEKDGNYEISLYRWAPYLNKKMELKSARLKIADFEGSMELPADATKATFKMKLTKGDTQLHSFLVRENGDESGAYYVKVEYLGDGK